MPDARKVKPPDWPALVHVWYGGTWRAASLCGRYWDLFGTGRALVEDYPYWRKQPPAPQEIREKQMAEKVKAYWKEAK